MKTLPVALLAAALCSAPAFAQMTVPNKGDSSMKMPSDPGMKTPKGSGAVVTPPSTGNEEMVKTPSKVVDPKIDDGTSAIDRRNRQKADQQPKPR